MRMTKQMKEAFVESVLADVPVTDYEEQIRAVILTTAVEALPRAVRLVWDDTALRGYVNTAHYSDYKLHPGVGVHVPSADHYDPTLVLTAAQRSKLAKLQSLREEQDEMLRNLRSKLRATVESITTTQQLVNLLPEFKDYVPAEEKSPRSVPAIANLVSDLMTAGWPKGGKKD